MSGKTFNETAMEMLKIYFSCHPNRLPEDADKAFKEMSRLYSDFKGKLIDQGMKRNEDFFSDKF